MNSRSVLAATLFLFAGSLYSQTPFAILGGDQSSTLPYAALISPTGAITPVLFSTDHGAVFGAALNSSGMGILGGQDSTLNVPLGALVSPTAILIPFTSGTAVWPPPAVGGSGFLLYSVAINTSGAGLIGGSNEAISTTPYAALVNSEGQVNAFTSGSLPATGSMNSVALNDSGIGIIGGSNGNDLYAAVVENGALTALTLPLESGGIATVAINASGIAFIGGNGNGESYGAVVSNGSVTSFSGSAWPPSSSSEVGAVAINSSGSGIIGGEFQSPSLPYAALVNSSGVVTPLNGSGQVGSGDGQIRSVAINDSGAAIIGGVDNNNTDFFGAVVSSNGTVTLLTGNLWPPAGGGEINNVGINQTGAALIGGYTNSGSAYAALVSPTGIVTPLSGAGWPPPNGSAIFTLGVVGLTTSSATILGSVVPQTVGGGGTSFANGVFSLSSVFVPDHCMNVLRGGQKRQTGLAVADLPDDADLVASNEEVLLALRSKDVRQTTYRNTRGKKGQKESEAKYNPWFSLFGENVHQTASGAFPSTKDWIGGGILAFDYLGIRNTVIGGGAAYIFNYVRLGDSLGHATVQQEMATAYASWIRDYFYINGALWGGVYQLHNVRHSAGTLITSTSHSNGWLFIPHVEIGTPFAVKSKPWLLIDPFVMFDWANNWQGRIQEHGPSGFNLVIGHQYVSLLRSEVGLRLFETLQYDWGSLILEEKGSYVNKKPFHVKKASTFFVGSASTFFVETFSNQVQNLGVIQLSALFTPNNIKYPYGSLNYQGEFGSSFQANLVSVELGWNF